MLTFKVLLLLMVPSAVVTIQGAIKESTSLVDLVMEDKKELENLRQENKVMKDIIGKIHKEYHKYQDTRKMVKKLKAQLQAVNKLMSEFQTNTSKKVTDFATQTSVQRKQPGNIAKPGDTTVAFTLGLNGKTYSYNAVMEFTKVWNSYGNGYKNINGKLNFTKPGTFFFQLSLLGTTRRCFACFVVKNDRKTCAYPSGNTGNTYEYGSASLVAKLDIGDTIWIKSKGENCFWDGTSHLSGFLIAI